MPPKCTTLTRIGCGANRRRGHESASSWARISGYAWRTSSASAAVRTVMRMPLSFTVMDLKKRPKKGRMLYKQASSLYVLSWCFILRG